MTATLVSALFLVVAGFCLAVVVRRAWREEE